MRVSRLALLVILSLGLAGRPVDVRAGQQAPIDARVVNARDNLPILRARIHVGPDADARELLTDANGGVSMPAATSQDATITIARTGFLPVTIDYAELSRSGFVVRMTPAAVIEGVVVSDTGRPTAGLAIRVTPVAARGGATTDARTMTVFSNDLGEFRAAGLGAGRYRLMAYLDFDERARLRRNDTIVGPELYVRTPESLSEPVEVEVKTGGRATVTLTAEPDYPFQNDPRRQGVIAGAIFDELGDPMEGARVRLWRPTGTSRLLEQTGPVMTTDDRGRYRLYALSAGSYVVEVRGDNPSRGNPTSEARAATYAPGTTAIGQALPVRSNGRTETAGIDIVVRPSRVARLQGTAASASSGRFMGVANLVHQPDNGGLRLRPMIATLGSDGTFVFEQVPPGNYALGLRVAPVLSPQPGERSTTETALRFLSVGEEDPAPMRIVTTPTPTLQGRVVVEGTPEALPNPLRIGYRVQDASTNVAPPFPSALVQKGRFSIGGQTGLVVLSLGDAPKGWWLKAIMTPSRQSPDEPVAVDGSSEITLVLARTAATLTGRIVATTDPDEKNTTLIVFPTDRRRWEVPSRDVVFNPASPDGRFAVESLAPGDYYVVALAHATDHPDWDDIPSLLNALSATARRVSLKEGQTLGVDLRLTDALR